MNKLIGVYGASGCGVGIMPLIREQYLDSKIVFIDKKSNGLLNGHQIIDWAGFLEESSKQKFVSIAIANPEIAKHSQKVHEAFNTIDRSLCFFGCKNG